LSHRGGASERGSEYGAEWALLNQGLLSDTALNLLLHLCCHEIREVLVSLKETKTANTSVDKAQTLKLNIVK
jgi:hypothetical protein